MKVRLFNLPVPNTSEFKGLVRPPLGLVPKKTPRIDMQGQQVCRVEESAGSVGVMAWPCR